MSKNNRTKKIFIHRIVAQAFIENPKNYNVINHKDGNPSNNNVGNLEWCTQRENIKHCFEVLGYKGSNYKKYGKNANNHKRVRQYDINGNLIKEWDCIKDASQDLNIGRGCIGNCARKRSKTAGGYIWEFVS